MGIPGLTTFIQNRSHLFFEHYELHNTNLVIDGCALQCQLYNWHTKSYDCFGGDYDNYGAVVKTFFQFLLECKVTPYVIRDGGYESKKIATVMSRMKNKVQAAERLNIVTRNSVSVFPLFLNDTFLEVAEKLNIKVVTCDFESDTETANIARALGCPVLSYDSDFYIFDVLYIPFSTFEMSVKTSKKAGYKYIPCQVYKVERFLDFFGGLDKNNLPLLAVLLGNDYVKRSVFSMFFQNLKIQNCQGSEQQKRIKSLIVWLQNETRESAIRKVLGRFKNEKRKMIARKIQQAIEGYNCYDSVYMKYLSVTPVLTGGKIDLVNLEDMEESSASEGEIISEEEEVVEEKSSGDELCDTLQVNENGLHINPYFLENYRRCLYPSCFMDIMVRNQYYCIPQVEDYSQNHAQSVSLDIVSAIHKILTNRTENLLCLCRTDKANVGRKQIPKFEGCVPHLSELNKMDSPYKKTVLFRILKINETFDIDCLQNFPEGWQLFILAIKYLTENLTTSWPLIYALILCKIILECVDNRVGFSRSEKLLQKKYEKDFEKISQTKKIVSWKANIIDALNAISFDDSLICLQRFIYYFRVDEKLFRNHKLFNKFQVHSISQFQSCLLHIKHLNGLLDFPLQKVVISESLNCTFVYNFATNLKHRTNLDNYMEIILGASPTILNAFQAIVNMLKKSVPENETRNILNIRRRKRNRPDKTKEEHLMNLVDVPSDEEVMFLDPNNKFSPLSNV